MQKALQSLKKLIYFLVVFFFSTLCVLVLLQVFLRTIHLSQPWIEELSRYLFVWLIYLGGAITVQKGINISLDILLDSLSGKPKKIVFILTNTFSIIFLLIIVYIGLNNALINRIQSSTMIGLNMGIINLSIPVGALLMLLFQVNYLLKGLPEQQTSIER